MKEHLKDKQLSPEENRSWNRILRELNAIEIEILEFKPTSENNNHWTVLINPKEESTADPNFYHKLMNLNLKNGFKRSKKSKDAYWEEIFSEFDFAGFCIPTTDIQNVKPPILKSYLYFYQLLINKYPYQELFSSLTIAINNLPIEEQTTPHSIWFYIYYYSKFLHRLHEDSPDLLKVFGNWFSELFDQDNLHTRLPSEQITILLLSRIEMLVSNTDQQYQNKRIFSRGTENVNSFFENFETAINSFFGESSATLRPDKIAIAHQDMKRAFIAIFSDDYENLFLQEILDNQSKLELSSALSMKLQLRYGSMSLYNASGIIKDKILNSMAKAEIFTVEEEKLPKYKRHKKDLYPENVQFWYDLLPEKRAEIIGLVQEAAANNLLKKSEVAVNKRCRVHWMNLIDEISAPILVWESDGTIAYPQLNLFDDKETTSLRELKRQKEAEKAKEKEELEKLLRELQELDSMEELTEYKAKNSPALASKKLHKRWIEELDKTISKIKQKEKFYENRMKEFGIWDSKLTKKNKRLWLKEMLKIEAEVKPYITFVKKAFQAALPVRKTITFSEHRHVSDGIVFDADTLFDHEKWMRADVMKVMESKTEIGDAIQINTFCLDYSGSMNHTRMRNLFKILYLLVLGLEDRKSFDAFHFFSSKFIDVVGFSNEFTNRKVLFKIMEQITEQSLLGEIVFHGNGGTNMSEGIGKSHEKMQEFITDFQKINPRTNIVSSIFVITDGEPSLGITKIPELNQFIETKRQDGDVEIKGIFIKSEDDVSVELMEEIFGPTHYIETADFEEGVTKFVKIMTETYKQQRKNFKWKKKKQRLGLNK